MKIGVLGCFYECADRLEAVLTPWTEAKREHLGGHTFVLAGINMQFAEYAALGYPNEDEQTRERLRALSDDFDELIVETDIFENEAAVRTRGLEALRKHSVDLVWILDSDEYYTKADINRILGYVDNTPQFDHYHIHFENQDFEGGHWESAYFPPRIFRADRHGGISKFVWDNDIEWTDGTKPSTLVPGIVPRSYAYIPHPSWRKEDASKKIAYHRSHFGYCPFTIDESGNPSLDPQYFTLQHGVLPTANGDGTKNLKKQSLHVIMRTYSAGNYRENIQRVIDTEGGKTELTLRSLASLLRSLLVLERTNQIVLRLTVLDDHSDETAVVRIKALLALCPFPTAFVQNEKKGNESSMEHAFMLAREVESDFLYFVEDDYLHTETALSEMVESWRIFVRNLGGSNIALFPVDYIDRYRPADIEITRVVLGSRRHWRLITRTTFTFFIARDHLLAHFDIFMKGPQNGMDETLSTNVVWERFSYLFSPLPTLAIHLHEEPDLPPFANWRVLWDDAGAWL